jgi:hypothetical protein
MTERWTFGVEPLVQTEELAARLRRVTGLALSLEVPHPAADRLLADLDRAEVALAGIVPPDPSPRVGDAVDGDGRAYLDHARDVGAFNPCFPEYEITVDGARATGSVTFPIAYEGPPGLVHGGFLGVFVDCVVQHHNCDVGVAGKTTSLALRYRRPTPLLVPLTFSIERSAAEGRIRSHVELTDGDRVLCEAEVDAVAGDRANLPPVSPRRSDP